MNNLRLEDEKNLGRLSGKNQNWSIEHINKGREFLLINQGLHTKEIVEYMYFFPIWTSPQKRKTAEMGKNRQ